MPLFSNSTFPNWLVRDRFLLLGQEAKGRSLNPNQSPLVTARGNGADLDLSPKDRVSVMHESVLKVSVIGKGSKRARMRASGLFRIPVTMIIAVLVMMVGSASALAVMAIGPGVPSAGAATPGAGLTISALAQPSNFSPSRNAECKIARETEPLLIGQWSEHCDRYTAVSYTHLTLPTIYSV